MFMLMTVQAAQDAVWELEEEDGSEDTDESDESQ